MDWNQAMEDDRRMLKSIIATLFALALLAERLCDRSVAVRGFVMWLLRHAEEVVGEFVLDMAQEQGIAVQPAYPDIASPYRGHSPADAMALANTFRFLAILLGRLADLNQGLRLTPATRAAGRLLLALTSLEQILLHRTPAQFAERYDSS